MLTIDGSFGEGGGQIIRSALALSLVTGEPFRVYNIRAGRDRPGLKQQHLTAVRAAATIGSAQVEVAGVGARELTFVPGEVKPGDYVFRIGTAGSTTLVLQTILPPLMIADEPSTVRLEGGTHNMHAPPFDFLDRAFLPLVNRTGPRVSMELERYGFYPPGGGRIKVLIEPSTERKRLDLLERGRLIEGRARSLVVKIPLNVAVRELNHAQRRLGWSDEQFEIEQSSNALSPGNVLTIELESEHITELFTGVGERGVRGETVAEVTVLEVLRYLDLNVPVGEYLADQLLIPLALAGGGSYVTGPLSLHTKTNIEVVKMFLDVEITATEIAEEVWKIDVEV